MVGKDLRYNLEIATKEAQQNLGKAEDAAKDVAEQLDDTRTAGKKLADGMNDVADSIEADLRATASAADKLGQALGPELSSRVNTTEIVGELRKAGLTLDDVEQDAEELAAAIKRLDDVKVNVGQLDTARTKAVGVGDEVTASMGRAGDASRSFSGNLVGDMAGAATGLGPVSEGVAQLTEGLLEGSVNFKQLLKGGIAMAGAAVGVMAVTKAIEYFGAKQREINERAKEVATALEEQAEETWELATASGAATGSIDGLAVANEALSKALTQNDEDGRKLVLALGAVDRTSKDALDTLVELKKDPVAALRDVAIQAGLTADQAELLADKVAASDDPFWGASEANLALTEEMKAAGKAMEELQDQAEKTDLQKITNEFLNNAAATDDAAGAMIRLAESQLGVSRSEDGLSVYLRYNELLADAANRAAAEVHHLGEAARNGTEPARKFGEVVVSAAKATERAERATRDYDAAISALLGKLDAEETLINLGNQFDELELAQREAAAATELHGEKSNEATEAAERLRLKQIDVSRDMITYASEVLKLPEHRITEFQALIDAGSAAEVQAEINRIAASRKVWMELVLDVNAAKQAVKDAKKNGQAHGGRIGETGIYPVGEAGMELVELPQGAQVHNASATQRILGAASGPGGTVIIYTQLDERRVVEAVQRHLKNGGRLYGMGGRGG